MKKYKAFLSASSLTYAILEALSLPAYNLGFDNAKTVMISDKNNENNGNVQPLANDATIPIKNGILSFLL